MLPLRSLTWTLFTLLMLNGFVQKTRGNSNYTSNRDDDRDDLTAINITRFYTKANSSSLRQVLFLYRHGDRTADHFDGSEDETQKFLGPGQLTKKGKLRVYLLGQLTRFRYNEFLHGSINKRNLFSRSSAHERCIESVQLFLANFLGFNAQNVELDREETKKLIWLGRHGKPRLARLWQPAAIQVVPERMDGMLSETARCKREAEAKELLEKGVDVDELTKLTRRLHSGLLMNDMIKHMKSRIAHLRGRGDGDDYLFVHYSSHDITVNTLLGMLGQWEINDSNSDDRLAPPDFAANLAIELHEDSSSGTYYVRLFYMPRVPQEPIELQLPGCSSSSTNGCPIGDFERLLSEYLIPSWQDWMRECDNDLSQIDPYSLA